MESRAEDPQSAALFGHQLKKAFGAKAGSKRLGEIRLFRHLISAFSALPSSVGVEEYHGRKSHVAFQGAARWTRKNPDPVCELSDLAIIWVRRDFGWASRVTFVQAKVSKGGHRPCNNPEVFNETFEGDSQQWYLLNKRPLIRNTHSRFVPPPGLLRGAILPSVGSFGVFYKPPWSDWDLFYTSADIVGCPMPDQPKAKAKMEAVASGDSMTFGGLIETKFACCLELFGSALQSGTIGTPLTRSEAANEEDQRYRDNVGAWLAANLKETLKTQKGGPLAKGFVKEYDGGRLVDEGFEDGGGVGHFILIDGTPRSNVAW